MLMNKGFSYLIGNISLPFNASVSEAFSVVKSRLKSAGLYTRDITFSVYRRSVDARKKNDIRFVYSIIIDNVAVLLPKDRAIRLGLTPYVVEKPIVEFGTDTCEDNIVVVGSGPCGLFCSLLLAENGFKPILIERGSSVHERKLQIDKFIKTRVLDTDTNIQFGAGGAGTFSDGKLVTRTNDSFNNYVLSKLVEFGAPKEILTLARPHIGTDVLLNVIDNALKRIVILGGRVMYNTKLLDFHTSGNRVKAVITDKGAISCQDLVLAIGHSARDTHELLISKGINVEGKSFSVGMRIEHPVDVIDKGMYGDNAGNPLLGHAEYNLSYDTKNRGVYTFCMCPGGVVVPAASEVGGVVTNGMSYHSRDGRNSNSAVCCTVFKSDYGSSPLDAIGFQRYIERRAFDLAGGDYSAPVITVGDLLSDKCTSHPGEVLPTYMDGKGVRLVNPGEYFPRFVVCGLKNGILDFEKKIRGFAMSGAVLTGPETRTSSPVRIHRETTGLADGYYNLYPSGEGAGYAGGITSAAIDGIRTAMAIMRKYRRN